MSDNDQSDWMQSEATTPPAPASSSTAGKSRLPLFIALGVMIALLVGGALWWRSFTRSPGYSLGQLAKAAQEKDWDGVQKYVDIDALVDQLMDVAVGQTLAKDDSGLGALAAGLFESMKPALAEQVKDGLRESVEQGGGDGQSASSALAGVFAADKVKKVTYIGEEALVTLEVDNDGKPMDLKLRMKRVDDFWRITAIENIGDLPIGGLEE